jgi:hypothetical protein
MLQYFTIVTCDRCINQISVQINKESFTETIGGMPKVAWDYIHKNKWKDLPDDKHICPKCKKSWADMNNQVKKIKREYWGE